MSRITVACLVTATFLTLMTKQSHSLPNVTDLLENCGPTSSVMTNDGSCDGSNINCTLSEVHNITNYSISMIRGGDNCLLFACAIDHTAEQNISCAVYNLNCSSNSLCDTTDNQVEGRERSSSSSSSNSSDAVLTAFLVLFIVALLVAGFVILTMALMIRDMKNERVQDDLPNPYSCIFSFTKSFFAKSEEREGEPPKKAPKKKKKISESGAKHYRRKEKAAASKVEENDPESPEHDPDDYEEMEKRDSFIDGEPDDVYQNT